MESRVHKITSIDFVANALIIVEMNRYREEGTGQQVAVEGAISGIRYQ